MALVNSIPVVALAPAASQVLPHGLDATPDVCLADAAAIAVTADATSITVTNNGTTPASFNVLCWLLHSVVRTLPGGAASLTPRPFSMASGVGGGGSVPQPTWVRVPAPDFQNNWVNIPGEAPLAYALDAFGTAYIRGYIQSDDSGLVVTVVPAIIRPPNIVGILVLGGLGSGLALAQVLPNGNFALSDVTTSAAAGTTFNISYSTLPTPP